MLATLKLSLLGTDRDYSRGQEQRNVKVLSWGHVSSHRRMGSVNGGKSLPSLEQPGKKTSVLNQGQQTRYASSPGAEIHRCETEKQRVNSVWTLRMHKAFALVQLPWTQKISRPQSCCETEPLSATKVGTFWCICLFYSDFSVSWGFYTLSCS